jgi:hypothetical protein
MTNPLNTYDSEWFTVDQLSPRDFIANMEKGMTPDDEINIAQRHRFGVPIVPLTEMKPTWYGWPWVASVVIVVGGIALIVRAVA